MELDGISDSDDFAPSQEITEPDWSTDTTTDEDTSGSYDDSDFRMPPEIREPDWDS